MGNAVLAEGTLSLNDSSSVTGTGLFTLASAATLTLDHTVNMPGSLTATGTVLVANSSVVFTITNKLTLATGGVLNNPGTVQVGVYENDGGTVIGNAPIILGPAGLVVSNLRLVQGPGVDSRRKSPLDAVGTELLMTWSGPAPGNRVVERSFDLRHWTRVEATPRQISPGRFEARLGPSIAGAVFYRLCLVPPQTGP